MRVRGGRQPEAFAISYREAHVVFLVQPAELFVTSPVLGAGNRPFRFCSISRSHSGELVGIALGVAVGVLVGACVGVMVGVGVAVLTGAWVGVLVGSLTGAPDVLCDQIAA